MKPARRLLKALPLAVALSGVLAAPALAAKPTIAGSGSFGSQAVGGSIAKVYVITNNSSAQSFSSTITTGGANFAVTASTCGSVIPAAGSCNVTVTFTPTSAGTKTGNLRVQGNTTNEFKNKALDGNGTVGGASLSPTAFNFADTLIGSFDGPETFTVSVQPFQTVTITGVTSNSDNFVITDSSCTDGLVLNSGTLSCTVDVEFNPQSTGAKSGQLQVATSAGTLTSSLTGNGLGATTTITPVSLNFGSIPVGLSAANKTITFTNTGDPGSVNSIISPVTLSAGAGALGFSLVSNTCAAGASFFPGDSCDVVVGFTGVAPTGAKSASVKFTYNENGANPIKTFTVPLSGTAGTSTTPPPPPPPPPGCPPACGGVFSASPDPVDFGTNPNGIYFKSTTITNTGGGPLNLGSAGISASGSNANRFFVNSSTCPTTLAASASCVVNIEFKDTSTGSNRTATLVFSSGSVVLKGN